jgi:hypothetical protein
LIPIALIRPFKPQQSLTIIDSEFSYTLLINTLFVATKQTAKSKAKEASNIRNKAIIKEVEVRKQAKSRGKFNLARNNKKK